jgi:glutamate formiminotransferase/glutamate formiminotransferase/formiminotetrahydrofolate cyclodeaminase
MCSMRSTPVTLLAVPNISEGRDRTTIEAIGAAFEFTGARVLDVHADPDHHRSVFTLAGEPGGLARAVIAGAREALRRTDLAGHDGIHPRVGVIDVAPIVYLHPDDRGAACAEALVQADMLGAQLGLPVFMYGELADGRTRADLRRGGPSNLAARVAGGELRPDFGPGTIDPRVGAVLVAARPPLVAFNIELAPPATVEDAKRIAALIRESGPDGLPGVRAIGLWLDQSGTAQISTNVEDPLGVPLVAVVGAIARHATPAVAELVGLAPRRAFDGFPDGVPVRNKRMIEDVIDTTI